MNIRRVWLHGALLLVLSVAVTPASAGDFTFTTTSEEEIDWHDPLNWTSLTPGALPGAADDVTVAAGLLRGAEVMDARSVNSIVLDSGLNVFEAGTLSVTSGITGNAGYFINAGTITADVVNRTYIANTGAFRGDVTNMADGAVINDGDGEDGRTGQWTGDITSNAGFVSNSFGIWTGDVVGNTGMIVNANGAIWNGDVTNSADVESTDSTWNGDLTNSGVARMTGALNGNITNSGTVWMDKSLSGVGTISNTGRLGLEDDAANDTLSATSWSGTGTLTVDFDPSLGRSDKVVLSGNYSADTLVEFRLAGPDATRVLGEVPVIVVGGANTGTTTATGLPDGDRAIVYALQRSGNDWVVAAAPGAVVADVAGVWALAGASLAGSTQFGLGRGDTCAPGAMLSGLHGDEVSGLRLDLDLACTPLAEEATLDIGVTLGLANGDNSGRQFAGLYGELIDGAFRAVLEGQVAATQFSFTDARLGPDPVSLAGTGGTLSGSASYALALGTVTLAPEAGLALRGETATSSALGNAGGIHLTSGPTVSAHAGVTLSTALPLDAATTLTPFATIALHGDVLSPGIVFTDSAGTSARLPAAAQSPYVVVALGADVIRAEGLDAGMRGELKVASGTVHTAVSGNLRVPF